MGWLPENWGCLSISRPYCFEPGSRQFIVVGLHSRASCSPDGQEGNSKREGLGPHNHIQRHTHSNLKVTHHASPLKGSATSEEHTLGTQTSNLQTLASDGIW